MTIRTFPAIPKLLNSAASTAEWVLQSIEREPVVQANKKILDAVLGPVFACSPFIADRCQRTPTKIVDLLHQGLLDHSQNQHVSLAGYKAHLCSLVPPESYSLTDEGDLMKILREFRHFEMIRIGVRDILALNSVEDTLKNLSDLAEACVDLTECYSRHNLIERFGPPTDSEGESQKLIVLAMGKLGGRELNFSSDIDLILVYPESGQTTGNRKIDNADFFRRQAQSIVRILGQITEDGFVFRTDLRLRPFGESGPLVMNFNGIENYYLTQGREWERYAMIKARPICGSTSDRTELTDLLKPFIYRRYLDYSAFESLRDLKQRIAAQVKQKNMYSNIKLGSGGIREIEFIAQAFQLVRGGRESELQDRSLLSVLDTLKLKGLVTEEDFEALISGYIYLRKVENHLQMMHDTQTHDLPEDEISMCRLQYVMGAESWDAFLVTLNAHRQQIESIFESVFNLEAESDPVDDDKKEYREAWLSVLDEQSVSDWLALKGFDDPEQLSDALSELATSRWYSRLTTRGQQRVDLVIPLIMQVVAKENGSVQAALGLLKLVRSVAGRSVYLQVLLDTEQAVALLARLFSRSTWLAEFVSQHPIVIDELIDYRNIENPPDRESLESEMAYVLDRIRDAELDVQMDALRQYRLANTMRIAAAELEGRLDLMRISDRLSWLAEVVLQAVADLVWTGLVEKFGQPSCLWGGEKLKPGFAVVAYGKLGGLELGYGSDLDMVFLHDSEGEKQITDGDRSIENQVFFARLAQKLVNFISTVTPAGVLYETDTRLRPNGQSGMLVSGVSAFEDYQQNEAWTWEHQALVRARVVVGKPGLASRFNEIRSNILARSRPGTQLLSDVVEMRQRMRKQLGSGSAQEFDLKQDFGGIADIEFMVQYMVLRYSSEFSELATDTDNIRILDRIELLGLMPSENVGKLRQCYLALRGLVHKAVLQEKSSHMVLDAELLDCTSSVKRIWNETMSQD